LKLERDSSLHYVSLRMTDTCVFKEGVVGGVASNNPLLLPDTQTLVILSEAKNLIFLVGQYLQFMYNKIKSL
jgi:hypothetical protein